MNTIQDNKISTSIGDTGYIESSDGTKLFFRRWLPPKTEKSQFAAIVFHGIGYHSEPYRVIGNYLSNRGIIVYGFDARGHGHSGRERGKMESPEKIHNDINQIVTFVRQTNPQHKLFLIGESMGGGFVASYAKDHNSGIAGIILIAPSFKVHVCQYLKLKSITLFPVLLLLPDQEVLSLIDKKLDESSRDKNWVINRRADTLALSHVSGKYLSIIQQLTSGWKSDIPRQISVPVLILHGAKDKTVDISGSSLFLKALNSKDKELIIIPEAPHTILWDDNTPHVLEKMYSWIRQHDSEP